MMKLYSTFELPPAVGLKCKPDEGLTQQQFAEEADINTIVRRFGLTGELPENPRLPTSGDFSDVTDFQSAMNAVTHAEQQFMTLPPELRKRFNHDPGELIAFMEDGNNRKEAIALGLINAPPERTRDAVQAIDELRATMAQSAGASRAQGAT